MKRLLWAVFTALVAAAAATAQQPATTLQGRAVDWQELRRHTAMVVFFSIRMEGAQACLQAIEQVHAERREANLEVLAVSIDDRSEAEVRAFVQQNRLSVPVLLDGDGRMRAEYQPQSMPHAYFFAEQGRYLGDLPGYPEAGSPTPAAFYANLLRRAVGLDVVMENDPSRTPWPPMPEFALPGGGPDSQKLKGAPYVLAFVAADCDRCRAQLELFAGLQREFAATSLRWLCVLVGDDDPAEFARERRLPFPVHADPDGSLRRTLHYRGFVPDTLLVDAEGRIRYRHIAFDDEQAPLYRMELRQLTGKPGPPILKPSGPSGARRCAVCHEREYFDWQASGHAHALRSLQAIGRADDPDCVRCHVVGWGRPGGFDADAGARAAYLQDVQCESCHGDGGPHLQQRTEPARVRAEACTQCHDAKHSLGFDFDAFVKLVDHGGDLRTASPEQRAAVRQRREEQRRALLEPDGAYAGADACRTCHAVQFEAWKDTPHARAFARLPAASAGDPACAVCHATGTQRRWVGAATPAPGAEATRGVQCESCHGPGARHVEATTDAARRETITGLGARCEECVVRQICTNCHDRANDAGFDFARALPGIAQRCRQQAAGR